MRSGEVCRISTGSINTAGSVWTYTPEMHKTKYRGHRRTVYLGPWAQAILREWLRTELFARRYLPSRTASASAHWRHSSDGASPSNPTAAGVSVSDARYLNPALIAADYLEPGA